MKESYLSPAAFFRLFLCYQQEAISKAGKKTIKMSYKEDVFFMHMVNLLQVKTYM